MVAHLVITDAFKTDLPPLLAHKREKMGVPEDPIVFTGILVLKRRFAKNAPPTLPNADINNF